MARLTPRDIQEKEFSSGFRGYKEQDVDEFLDRVTASYEEVFKENIDVKEEVDRLMEENKKYELIGERMQAALVAAQETADDVRKNATKEAENILREAEIKAHKLVQASRDQHRELQKSLAIVKQIEEEFRFKLKSTLQSYLKLLDEVALGDKKEIQKWILPEDMTVLDERRREMEAEAAPAARQTEPRVMAAATGIPGTTAEMPAVPSADDTAAMAAADKPVAKKEIAAEVTAGEVASSPKDQAPHNDDTAAKAEDMPAKTDAKAAKGADAKAAEEKAALDKKAEEAKAKAAALMEEIAQQAAEAEAEEKATTAKAKADKEAKAEAEKPPFDPENAKASAVTPEWAKLQEAVAEAVKEAEKPAAAKAEAPKAAAKADAKDAKALADEVAAGEITSSPKDQAPRADAKTETKEAKGKSNLDDIEIVEDESFWKDI